MGTSLIAAGNTYNACLFVLVHKGYQLSVEEIGEGLLWNARRGDNTFSAYSPPELLGLVAMWESRGADWNKQVPDIIADLTK
jgi:hypothetical protein